MADFTYFFRFFASHLNSRESLVSQFIGKCNLMLLLYIITRISISNQEFKSVLTAHINY